MLITRDHNLFPGGIRLGEVFDVSSPFYDKSQTEDLTNYLASVKAATQAYDKFVAAQTAASLEARKKAVFDSSGRLINGDELQTMVNAATAPALAQSDAAQQEVQNQVALVAAQSQAAVAAQAVAEQARIDVVTARNAAAAAEIARQAAQVAGNKVAEAAAEAARQQAQTAATQAALIAEGNTAAAQADRARQKIIDDANAAAAKQIADTNARAAAAAAAAEAAAKAAKNVVDQNTHIVTKNIITDGVVTTTDLTPASNLGTIALITGVAFLLLRR
jgi:hypothetical protein